MPQASTLKPSRSPVPTSAPAEAHAFAPSRAFAMLSDRGRVRSANQDACGARPERGVFAVCDGMGGPAGGEIASRLALETFLKSLDDSRNGSLNKDILTARRIPPKAASSAFARASGHNAPRHSQEVIGERAVHPPANSRARLEEAIRAANQAVYRHSQKLRALRGMGTTLVALLLEDATHTGESAALPGEAGTTPNPPRLWLAHAGDSRCYRLRSGVLTQLTRDHSLVEEQVQAGLLSRVEAGSSPIRNIITRAVGSQPIVEPEIASHPTQPGDLYLLASDGLTRELDDAGIARILRRATHPGPVAALEHACQSLIDEANARGGNDNITVLLVQIP